MSGLGELGQRSPVLLAELRSAAAGMLVPELQDQLLDPKRQSIGSPIGSAAAISETFQSTASPYNGSNFIGYVRFDPHCAT